MDKKFVTIEQLKKTANNILKKVRDKGYSTEGGGGGGEEIIDYGRAYERVNSKYLITISFNKTFTTTPTVVCNLIHGSSTVMYLRINEITNTYFDMELFSSTGTKYKGESYFPISWFAIGT